MQPQGSVALGDERFAVARSSITGTVWKGGVEFYSISAESELVQTPSWTHESSGITSVAKMVAPDGAFVVAGGLDGDVYILSASLEEVDVAETTPGHSGPVSAVSVNDQTVASASWDMKINIYNTNEEGNLARTRSIFAHSSPILSATYNPKGSVFSSGSQDGHLKLWDFISASNRPTSVVQTDSPVFQIGWKDEFVFATALESGVKVFDSRNLTKAVVELSTSRPSHVVAFSSVSPSLLAYGDDAGQLKVVNVDKDAQASLVSKSYNDFVRALSWSTLKDTLLVSSWAAPNEQLVQVKTD